MNQIIVWLHRKGIKILLEGQENSESNAQEYSRLQSSSVVIRALLVGRLEDALGVLAGSSSLSPVLLWLILARFLL